MSVPEWFAVGIGCAGALWWWRFIVQSWLWDEDPDTNEKPTEPSVAEAITVGTIIWALSPVWAPIWALHKVWTGQVHVLREFGRRTNKALLKAFPDRNPS